MRRLDGASESPGLLLSGRGCTDPYDILDCVVAGRLGSDTLGGGCLGKGSSCSYIGNAGGLGRALTPLYVKTQG